MYLMMFNAEEKTVTKYILIIYITLEDEYSLWNF